MTVTESLLASMNNATAGVIPPNKSQSNLATSQAMFGTSGTSFKNILSSTQNPTGAPQPIIFNSALPTTSAASIDTSSSAKAPTAQDLGAALTAYARQSISAGASATTSAARVGSDSINLTT